MEENKDHQRARQRVLAIRGFYTHLIVYVAVNAGLVLLNVLSTPTDIWFYWPLLGWGIGLAAHAFAVFGPWRWFDPEWEERQIKKTMEKDKPS